MAAPGYECARFWFSDSFLVNFNWCSYIPITNMTTRSNIIQISQVEWTLKLSLKAIRQKREKLWKSMLTTGEGFSRLEDAWIELWDQTMDCLGAVCSVGSERYEDLLDKEWDRQIDIYLKLEKQGRVLQKITDRTKWLKKSREIH